MYRNVINKLSLTLSQKQKSHSNKPGTISVFRFLLIFSGFKPSTLLLSTSDSGDSDDSNYSNTSTKCRTDFSRVQTTCSKRVISNHNARKDCSKSTLQIMKFDAELITGSL